MVTLAAEKIVLTHQRTVHHSSRFPPAERVSTDLGEPARQEARARATTQRSEDRDQLTHASTASTIQYSPFTVCHSSAPAAQKFAESSASSTPSSLMYEWPVTGWPFHGERGCCCFLLGLLGLPASASRSEAMRRASRRDAARARHSSTGWSWYGFAYRAPTVMARIQWFHPFMRFMESPRIEADTGASDTRSPCRSHSER